MVRYVQNRIEADVPGDVGHIDATDVGSRDDLDREGNRFVSRIRTLSKDVLVAFVQDFGDDLFHFPELLATHICGYLVGPLEQKVDCSNIGTIRCQIQRFITADIADIFQHAVVVLVNVIRRYGGTKEGQLLLFS